MPKYIRRARSTKRNDGTDALRDALLRDLERQGQKLLKDLTSQFTKDLEKQSTQLLQNLFSTNARGNASGIGAPGIDTVTSLVGSLLSYAVSKPKTSTRTVESQRSRAEESQFRLSRAQAMAEATSELSRSNRNV